MQVRPWLHRGHPAMPPPGHEEPNRNNTLHTTWALVLLQNEFAMGLLAKTPGFVLEELLLCHLSECSGFALEGTCSSCLAAREEILGEMGERVGVRLDPRKEEKGL